MDVLSPFISVLCYSDSLFHSESCPRLDVIYPGCAWSSSPACTWHCSLHYFFLQANSLVFSLYDHTVLASLLWQCLTVPSLLLLIKLDYYKHAWWIDRQMMETGLLFYPTAMWPEQKCIKHPYAEWISQQHIPPEKLSQFNITINDNHTKLWLSWQ